MASRDFFFSGKAEVSWDSVDGNKKEWSDAAWFDGGGLVMPFYRAQAENSVGYAAIEITAAVAQPVLGSATSLG